MKIKPKRSKKYLDFIRSKPCYVCRRPAEPHHIRLHAWGAGMGIKPHDYCTIPLCRICHEGHIDIEKDIDAGIVIVGYLIEYIEELK